VDQHEVALLAGVDQLRNDAPARVQFHVGLGDDVLVFLPRRQVVRVGLVLYRLFLRAHVAVDLLDLRAARHVAHLVMGIPRVEDFHLVDHHPVLHPAVGALDEPVLVDPREAR